MNKIRIKKGNADPGDAMISRHKNFEQLMSAYKQAPAANGTGIGGIMGKKLLLFVSGLISGVVATVVIITSLPQSEETRHNPEVADKIMSNELIPSANELQPPVSGSLSSPFIQSAEQTATAKTEDIETGEEHDISEANETDIVEGQPTLKPSAKDEIQAADKTRNNRKEQAGIIQSNSGVDEYVTEVPQGKKKGKASTRPAQDKKIRPAKDNAILQIEGDSIKKKPKGKTTPLQSAPKNRTTIDLKIDKEQVAQLKAQLHKAAIQIADSLKSGIKDLEKLLPKEEKKTASPDIDTSSANLENADTSQLVSQETVISVPQDTPVQVAKAAAPQKDSTYSSRPFQISFITPMSTNGPEGGKYVHTFSLNILQGYSGALKGVEFGGLSNFDKGYVYGGQFAGISNYAGNWVKGVQAAGIVNVAKNVTGAQLAGIANLSRGYVKGMQAAGIVNVCIDSFAGTQLAGIVNMGGVRKGSKGFQAAGVSNFSSVMTNGMQVAGVTNFRLGDAKGGQISGVANIAKNLQGIQIGLINVAKNVKGIQIGLINISESNEGAAIGLLSFVKNGRRSLDLWSGDAMQANIGFKSGSRRIYNIYAAGLSFNGGTQVCWGAGLGIGTHIPVKKAFIDMDVMSWSINGPKLWNTSGINLLNQFRLMGGKSFSKKFGAYAGPTFNVLVHDNQFVGIQPYTLAEYGTSTKVKLWVGFVAGIQLFSKN